MKPSCTIRRSCLVYTAVVVWNTDDGLLGLGYPKDSYTKLTSNYYAISALRRLPVFVLGMLGLEVLCLFCAYYCSKRKIIRNTEPIVSAVETLADGKPVSLHISGELSEIANSVNKASSILNRQNVERSGAHFRCLCMLWKAGTQISILG